MKYLSWLKNSFLEEKDYWILWLPVIFAFGIIFYFSYSANSSYTFPLLLLSASILISILVRKELLFLITISLALFLGGFLWAKIYTEKIIHSPQIKHKLYATAIGKIDEIHPYQNSITKRTAIRLVLKDVQLYKVVYSDKEKKSTDKKKKRVKKLHKKKIKKNKIKKPRKKRKTKAEKINEEASLNHDPQKEIKKSKKISKTVIKNYFNVAGYQEIDRELKSLNYLPNQNEWRGNKYVNPPQKISINVNTSSNGASLGDVIMVTVLLEPFKRPNILGGHDFGRDAYFKNIGANGFATNQINILKRAQVSNRHGFDEKINNLRHEIADKILAILDGDKAGIAIALTVGYQNYISKSLMSDIRNSGLAHLLAISGLHLTLATGIFFFCLRFILSNINYLALNYDIKKISAFIAIIAGFAYLLISGMPVSALRSFIMVSLIFLAILFDQNANLLRSVALAALIIIIINPSAILGVSFQLSFAAILALITLYNFTKSFSSSLEKPFYLKFIFYFLSIISSSIAAEIAIAPLSIYHFNNYVQYGMIANLIAIPLTSFFIMPFGFLSFFLMPFHLEKLAIYPMGIFIEPIIYISKLVANIPYSHHTIKMIEPSSLGCVIIGGLWFCVWQKNWRMLGIVPIILGIFLAYKTPVPNLLIDGDRKYFAFYDQKDGLVFSKKIRSSAEVSGWMKKVGADDYKIINNLSMAELKLKKISCPKEYCMLRLEDHNILALTARNKIDFICKNDAEIIINLTKYEVPECAKNKVIINNHDLAIKGGHFLFLQKNSLKIKTIKDDV